MKVKNNRKYEYLLPDHMTGKHTHTHTQNTINQFCKKRKKIVDRLILNGHTGLDLITEEFSLSPNRDYILTVFIITGKKYSQMCMFLCIIIMNIHLHFFMCSRAIANCKGTFMLVKPLMPDPE